MIKKVLKTIFILFFILNCTIVYAKENNYINMYGVTMTSKEYNELSNIYSKAFIENIDLDLYNNIKNYNKNNIIIKYYPDESILPLSDTHTTSYKRIKIIKNGNFITLTLKWLQMPSTRSFDVFGIRFDGPSLEDDVKFMQVYTNNSGQSIKTTINYLEKKENGFGTSFQLPLGNLIGLEESISFNYKNTGRIYGTYQHAQNNVILAQSKNYTISSLGYGNVLNFATNVKDSYDGMAGVYIDV